MNIIFRHFCPLNTVPDWAKYNHSQKTHICLYTKVITLYHILQRKCQTLHVCIISPTSASGWSLRAERTSSRERTNNSAYPTDLTSAVRLQEKLAFYIAWVQRYIHILVCPNQCTHQINLPSPVHQWVSPYKKLSLNKCDTHNAINIFTCYFIVAHSAW